MFPARILLSLPLLLGLCLPAAATADTGLYDVVSQRQFMLAADARCGLFDAGQRQALGAGLLQTRNEAIRQGLGGSGLYGTMNRAAELGQRADCGNSTLRTEAGKLSDAYRSFAQQIRHELKGQRSQWAVNRAYGDDQDWRLVQTLNAGNDRFAFGLYGTQSRKTLSVMAQFGKGEQPYAARLLIRRAGLPPIRRLDPNPATTSTALPFGFDEMNSETFLANGHSADKRIMVKEPGTVSAGLSFKKAEKQAETERFDFPSSALKALGPLDPRDDVVVAFDYGDTSLYVRFEAGDFIPGMIISNLPSPYTHNRAHSKPY